ncbi:hypothetical protein LSTR_LSTR008378 [Laodelphax striatellus]|uniref:Uncharacterized protein n=1 Tax=Laodelphax striatellus TaxID=195883 RepID=A0A482XSW4_LAOST|nr:hypothetical protein LSTR_LSTR008378 [Laodelphax striatellus]
MSEMRDFATQTDIPYLSIMNSQVWNQHLNQIKFDLKQIVLLSETFDTIITGLSDKLFYDIFHTIEHDKSGNIFTSVTEKLDEINNRYSGFKTALMSLLRNYFNNRTAMFNDLDKTNSEFLNNFCRQSLDSDEIELIRSGDRIKHDMQMIVNVINSFEFNFNDDLAEHFHDILSFAVKTCKKRSILLMDKKGGLSQILFTMKEGMHLTNYTGDAAIEPTESDRSLQRLSSIDITHAQTAVYYNDLTEEERNVIMALKRRSEEMTIISKTMEMLRENSNSLLSIESLD